MSERKTMFGNVASKSAKEYNAEEQIIINSRKIEIDKRVFTSSVEDKDILHRRKVANRNAMRKNSNMTERSEFLNQIANTKFPRFGSLSIGLLK